jgi:hypothetical protein
MGFSWATENYYNIEALRGRSAFNSRFKSSKRQPLVKPRLSPSKYLKIDGGTQSLGLIQVQSQAIEGAKPPAVGVTGAHQQENTERTAEGHHSSLKN